MPSPSGHHRGGPTSYAHPAHPDWKDWDAAWTIHIRAVADRDDLTVVVAPHAGGGAPACFIPTLARIEVDAAYIGTPQTANPHRAGHKRVVRTAYGLLLHEAGHAAHSRWTAPDDTPPVVVEVAKQLEEARIEGRHRSRRPRDRQWLRGTVTALVHPGDAPIDDPWHAAALAALLLARVDARILAAKDVRGVRDAITAILGRRLLNRLKRLWRQALQVADDDSPAMINLAWQWCHTIGIDPTRQPDIPIPDPGAFTGRLAAAVSRWAAAATGLALPDYLAEAANGTAHVARAAHTSGSGEPVSWTRRDPTPEEKVAARRLAARLAAARTTAPEPGRAPAALPPGRLRTRQAITAQAQIAAGQPPTATPWTRRAPQPPDNPGMRLAVLVDVSGSMRDYAAPMSSAAWILAHAGHGNHAVTATIGFAEHTTLLHRPAQRPAHVLDLAVGGGTETFIPAIKLADQLLELRRPGTLRLVAVVSDGWLADPEPAQKLISTLHRDGVTVLWLHPADMPSHTFTDTTTLAVTDPASAITRIADAMTTAFANA